MPYAAPLLLTCLTSDFFFKPTGTSPPAEKEKYVWRMHQPTEPRKYQLFPTLEKLSMSTGRRSPDAESEPAVLKSTIVAERERSGPGNLLRKTKEATLIRRRKISVPELGPMTTVQEVSMDSRMDLCSTLHFSLCKR